MKEDQPSPEEFEALLHKLGPAFAATVNDPPDLSAERLANLKKRLERHRPFLRRLTDSQMKEMLLLLFRDHSMDGVELTARLRKANIQLREGGEGVIYGLLNQLENSGLLESEWKEGPDRMRKIYRLTDPGRAQLAKVRSEQSQLTHWVELVIQVAM
jgi:DNA-binding PadR family transcriptional regulator